MTYCKYCYRILEDGCEICTSCGKSQTEKVKKRKKLLGIIPVYSEKHTAEAMELFYHAESSYELARESTCVLDFLICWKMLLKDNAAIRTYQELIPLDVYSKFSTILSKEEEFQWRLRDAIEASKLSTIQDIHGDYRNNFIERASMFIEDMERVTEYASTETLAFSQTAIREVAKLVGIDIRNPSLNHCAAENDTIEDLLSMLDSMEGHDFEYWCASLLKKIGFTNVEVTQGSGDQGVDVLAEKDGIRYAIQCKCYSSDLGNSPVQEVSAGKMMPQYHCQVGAVITNRHFTKGAKDLADATGTLLWDRDWIVNTLKSTSK